MRAFLARVRATNGDPHLFVVVVQALAYAPPPPLHDAQLVRAAQAAYVASDPDSVLVRVTDLPQSAPHLANAAAYDLAAARILDAIRAH